MECSHKCCRPQHLCENIDLILKSCVSANTKRKIFDISDCLPHLFTHRRNRILAQMLSAKTFVRDSEMKNSKTPPTDLMECNICASAENESKVIPYYSQSCRLNHTALIQIII